MIDAVKLKRLYEEQHAHPNLARTRADIPISFESITPEWLTAVLCEKHKGARVTGLRLAGGSDGSTNRRGILIEYNAAGEAAGLPKKVFCKATHDLQTRITCGSVGAAEAEIGFYQQMRPQLDIETTTALFCALDPESYNSIIVLEDIADRAEFCGFDTLIDFERASDMVGLMAAYHAKFSETPEFQRLHGFSTWPDFWDGQCSNGFEEFTNKGFVEAKAVIPPRLYARYDEIWPATQRSVDTHMNLPRTIQHGDVHLRNWYLTQDGRMGLTDWQNATVAHWSRDLAYALSAALTIENRRAWERDLIALYLKRMEAGGAKKVAFDEAFNFYRQQLFSALAYWTITLRPAPDMPQEMQPKDATLEFIRRMTVAIDDLDALDSF